MSNEKKEITQRKSNKSVKTAVLLFGAVLLTTSLLGGTLAKYVGEIGTASDTARVARWGITDQDQTLDLFDAEYDVPLPSGGKYTVQNTTGMNGGTSDGMNIFAPGTTKTVFTVPVIDEAKLNATETAFTLRYASDDDGVFGDYTGTWDRNQAGDAGVDWLPLRFSVYSYNEAEAGPDKYTTKLYDGITEHGTAASPAGSVHGGDKQLEELNKALKSYTSSVTIYPSDTLTEKEEKLEKLALKIVWSWPFNRPELGEDDATVNMIDGWDTVLGERAASLYSSGNTTDMPKFELSMKYTAVQVD